MRNACHFIIALVVLFRAAAGAAQSSQFVDFGQLPEAFERRLLSAVFDNERFVAPPVEATAVPDPQLTRFWIGNRPVLDARISAVRLGFTAVSGAPEAPTPAGQSNSQPEKVQIEVEFDKDRIVARSLKPLSRKYPGGIRFSLNVNKGWRYVFEVGKGVEMALAVSRLGDASLRGLLVCPLITEIEAPAVGKRVGTPSQLSSKPREYRWSSVSFIGDASAHGRFSAGTDTGIGYADILMSETMTPAEAPHDRAVARDVIVGADYLPEAEIKVTDVTNVSGASAGLVAKTDFQNAAGYHKVSKYSAVVWTKRIGSVRPFMAGKGRGETEVRPGECVGIVRQISREEAFSRDKLELPSDLLELAGVKPEKQETDELSEALPQTREPDDLDYPGEHR